MAWRPVGSNTQGSRVQQKNPDSATLQHYLDTGYNRLSFKPFYKGQDGGCSSVGRVCTKYAQGTGSNHPHHIQQGMVALVCNSSTFKLEAGG